MTSPDLKTIEFDLQIERFNGSKNPELSQEAARKPWQDKELTKQLLPFLTTLSSKIVSQSSMDTTQQNIFTKELPLTQLLIQFVYCNVVDYVFTIVLA